MQSDRWRAQYPTVAELAAPARRRLPYFAWDFLAGGTGAELAVARNADALVGIELVPRYGVDLRGVSTAARLFGREVAAPLGIAPIGMDGGIWPGVGLRLAEAAAALGLPIMTSTMSATPLEAVARAAPGFWFQLYSFPGDDHRISFDLARRAEAAGADVLALTLDVPVAPRRVRTASSSPTTAAGSSTRRRRRWTCCR